MNTRKLREYIHLLEDIKEQTSTPLITYAVFEKEAKGNAKEVVALMIKNKAWDGRISERNAKWADEILSHYETPESVVKDAHTTIHPAHLDQIADYARRLS